MGPFLFSCILRLTIITCSSIICPIMNRLNTQKRSQVVSAIVEGNSIRSTVRMTGVAKDTVLKLLAELGEACAEYHDVAVRNVHAKHIECDEIWAFCYAKNKNVPK